jgi:hypothetical protein
MLGLMDNKSWLIEVEVAVCLVVLSMAAFALMVGHHLWKYTVFK